MTPLGPRPADAVRVLTLNLWGCANDWDARRGVIVEALRTVEPDLVAFQEAMLGPDYDQATDLLGDDYTIVQSSAREAGGLGCAVGSRLPVLASREIDLQLGDRTRDFPCATLIVELESATHGRIVFANHNPSWQPAFAREREIQAVRAARALESIAGDVPSGDTPAGPHVVVAGDFDAEPDAASLRLWTGRQSLDGLSVCYRSAWEAAHPGEAPLETFTPRNPLHADPDWPFRAIDHILVRCALHGGPTLQVRACEPFLDQPRGGVWASDHFGLVADLAAPARERARWRT